MTNDEEAGSGATPGSRGFGGVGTLTESGPSPEEQPRTTEPPTPQAGALTAYGRGLLKGPANIPAKLKRDPTGRQAESGDLRAPGARFRSVGKEGSPGEGPAART